MHTTPRHPTTGQFVATPVVTDDPDRHWRARARALVAYRAVHGIWPKSGTLRAWLNAQRSAARTGTLSHERHQFLNNLAADWLPHFRDQDAVWRANAEVVGVFLRDHDHRPLKTAPGEEGRLGRWLAKQRAAATTDWNGPLPAHRREILDVVAPG